MGKSLDAVTSRTSECFDAFRQALETGNTENFLKKVAEGFHFFVPLPLEGWNHKQQGKERFEELIRFERSVFQMLLTPLLLLEDQDHGMVVFRSEGPLNGRPFSNELTIIFEFEGERIRSFREYVGMPLKNYENP
ncbi:nuclear transport factor 2 family protein [Paenibacillus glucanolyticus]|uniref:nuclear transport factor 2 family protein n=1 Tax=Paenibacillus glucanolyticus TaxID=59843 RepID=UPI00128ADF13|nr:nuclear transport factor 2 family protein [Paenibacillus glucanolyticus]MPY17587.1 nuclear transport factor 2 family protein [Paenibacillus glucanolyticus]